MKATVFRFPTTALPVQVQRDYLSYANVGAAPLTRPLKLLELLTLSKTRPALMTWWAGLFRALRKIQLKYSPGFP